MQHVRFINMSYEEILQFKQQLQPRANTLLILSQQREARAAAVMSAITARLIAQANNR